MPAPWAAVHYFFMRSTDSGYTKTLNERPSRALFHRMRRLFDNVSRRVLRKPRTVTESPNLLPLLIQVLAAFSKANGEVLEEEIDSSLGFLRYDYPEAVYSELRSSFARRSTNTRTSAPWPRNWPRN